MERRCFHLKQHAFLPVGRTGSGVVRRAWLSHAAARHNRPAMDARDDLVLDALTRELARQNLAYTAFFPLGGFTAFTIGRAGDGGEVARSDSDASGTHLVVATFT